MIVRNRKNKVYGNMVSRMTLLIALVTLTACGDVKLTSGFGSDDVTPRNGVYCDFSTQGVLWKPISEGDGNLVVLDRSGAEQKETYVIDAGETYSGTYVGHTNGNRATYRFSRQGSAFSAPVLYVGGCKFLVQNPAGRNE